MTNAHVVTISDADGRGSYRLRCSANDYDALDTRGYEHAHDVATRHIHIATGHCRAERTQAGAFGAVTRCSLLQGHGDAHQFAPIPTVGHDRP